MGVSMAWTAVKDLAPERVLEVLGLARTGRCAEVPEVPLAGCTLPGGWFLVAANRCDHPIVRPATLAKLSAGCLVVACSIEEHVMACLAEAWSDGARLWRAEHDAQRSFDDLRASGSLPEFFVGLAREHAARQQAAGGAEADVDWFFETPLQAAHRIVGFKHDESDLGEGVLEELRRTGGGLLAPEHKPWWRFW